MGRRKPKQTSSGGVTMEVSLKSALNTNTSSNVLVDKGSCQSIKSNNSGGKLNSRSCKTIGKENVTPFVDIQNNGTLRSQRSRDKKSGQVEVDNEIEDDSVSLMVKNGTGGENPSKRKSSRNKAKTVDAILDKENKEFVSTSEDVNLEDGSCTKCISSSEQTGPAKRNRAPKRRSVPEGTQVRRSKRSCVQSSSMVRSSGGNNTVVTDDKTDALKKKQSTEESQVILPKEPPERPPSPGTGSDPVETGSNSVPSSEKKGAPDVLVLSDDDRPTKGLNVKERSSHDSHSSTIAEMQKLYSKLHAKYQKLKARRHEDIEAYIAEQNRKFTAYVNAAEELLEHLRSDNSRLRLQANEANSAMALNRARLLERKNAECQNDLLVERSKSLELIKEVKRLQQLLSEQSTMHKHVQNNNKLCQNNNQLCQNSSTQCFSVSEGKYCCSQEKSVVLEPERQEGIADLSISGLEDISKYCLSNPTLKDAMVQTEKIDNVSHSSFVEGIAIAENPESRLLCNTAINRAANNANQVDNQIGNDMIKDSSGERTNVGLVRTQSFFQTLLQCMVGLKFSIADEGKQLQMLILHQPSGYSFKLKCLSSENDPTFKEKGELLYHVVSLGTLQKIAPEWMKEEIVFSMGQVDLFFERILQVANGCGHHLLVR
eukprot:Gb_30201 [translate_table: standard]